VNYVLQLSQPLHGERREKGYASCTLQFLIQYLGNARRESEPLYLKVSSFENRRVQLLASCKLSVFLDPLEQQSN
jgi:hypothetical protein